MQDDALFPVDDNPELMQELVDEAREGFDSIEAILLGFEKADIDSVKLDKLISNLQSLSAVMLIGGYTVSAGFADAIIKILAHGKEDSFEFTEKIVDILVLAIDYLRTIVETSFAGEPISEEEVSPKINALDILSVCPQEVFDKQISHVLAVLDTEHSQAPKENYLVTNIKDTNPYIDNNIVLSNVTDLEFFKNLMDRVELCHPELKWRGEYILDVSRAMNKEAGEPVNDAQLTAAVYMHDFGMMFIPSEPLRLNKGLSLKQREQMQEHPVIGAEILLRMEGWEEAAAIIMQHHEREDGNGYPNGLKEDAICDGASILAIADTTYAMTHKQTHRNSKRPFIRAAAEINACNGTQFAPYWIEIFNCIFRKNKGKLFNVS